MTIPWMMNCAHSDTGWCLDCVHQLGEDMARWREAAQQVVDLFDPTPGEASPALLVAVAQGAKAANADLRAKVESLDHKLRCIDMRCPTCNPKRGHGAL